MSTEGDKKPNNSPFEEILDPAIHRSILNTAFKTSLSFNFWNKEKTLLFDAKISGITKERIFFELPPSISDQAWDSAFSSVTVNAPSDDQYLFAKALVEKTVLFFKFLVAQREIRTIKLYPTPQIFKLQRRTNLRVRVSFVNKMFMEYEIGNRPGLVKNRIFDISSGGLSFVCKEEDESLYTNGTELKKIEFKLLGRTIQTDGVVRHTMKTRDESRMPVLKVGIQFSNMSPESVKLIEAHVEEESKYMFSAL